MEAVSGVQQGDSAARLHATILRSIGGGAGDTGRGSAARFCLGRADCGSCIGLALVHSEVLEAEEKLSLPSEKAQLGGQAGRLTGHFHGEEDDSNWWNATGKCPSKEGFFEMPPELLWKRRNVKVGRKGLYAENGQPENKGLVRAGEAGRGGKRGAV